MQYFSSFDGCNSGCMLFRLSLANQTKSKTLSCASRRSCVLPFPNHSFLQNQKDGWRCSAKEEKASCVEADVPMVCR